MKLTEWYSGDQKPSRAGVYQRDFSEGTSIRGIVYSKWDGGKWFVYESTAKKASTNKNVSKFQYEPWRGIAK